MEPTHVPVEVTEIDGLDAYTVRITGALLDELSEDTVFHLSRIIAIALVEKKHAREMTR